MLNANRDGTNLEDAQSPSENGKPCNTSVTPETKIATESGHWYLGDGTPFYTIKNGDGKERAVTLRDARKVNAVPSVTTITKIIASDGLQKYFDRQMFEACLAEGGALYAARSAVVVDGIGEQDLDILFARCRQASREHGRKAAEAGTALHGAIEQALREPFRLGPDEYDEHVAVVFATLKQYGIDLDDGEPEKSFAHSMGFGGKVDYHKRDGEQGGVIIDFKSKPSITPGKRYGYDNHAMQLAAYSMGLGMKYARCLNVFVGIEDKRVLIHEWSDDDLARGWNMFSLLLKFWQVSKNYYPADQ